MRLLFLSLKGTDPAEESMAVSNDELIKKYVEPNPNRPGPADVRLVPSGVSVWAIIGYLEAVHGDICQTATDYCIFEEAVRAALAYYRKHREVIDGRIAANAA
jgi:uncharacterized protein (DUF433 family)